MAKSKEGDYACRAANDAGFALAEARLTVSGMYLCTAVSLYFKFWSICNDVDPNLFCAKSLSAAYSAQSYFGCTFQFFRVLDLFKDH